MVVCELKEPKIEDYGKRVVRISSELKDLLNIEENEVVEIISGSRRIGVKAITDYDLVSKDYVPTGLVMESDKKEKKETKKSESKDLPEPEGQPFKGLAIAPGEVYPVRLDGEVRLSLGLSIGDMIEIDTIMKPPKAKKIYITIIGRDPRKIEEESKSLIFEELKRQKEPVSPGLILGLKLAFREEKILIESTEPDGIVFISNKTKFEILDTFIPDLDKADTISYEDIGGFSTIVSRVRKLVEIPIKKPEIFNNINLKPPKGILLTGPSGVGKTLILKALAKETGAYVRIVPSNLFAGVGPTEKNIKELFQGVKKEATKHPVILLLENMEALTPSPTVSVPEYVKRFNVQFALGIDSLKRSNAIVIGTCNSTEAIDPILRRPGRFDVEIELNVPTEEERIQILKIHLRTVPLDEEVTDEKLADFAKRMVGYVGADIALFVKEACYHAIARNVEIFSDWSQIPPFLLRLIKVNSTDFEEAFKIVEPSALRSIHSKVTTPDVKWDDVGGLNETKKMLKETIFLQFKQPKILTEMGVKPSRGILFYGPPGSGKTLLAKAIASELDANYISVKGPELLSVWFGESAKIIRELFSKAKQLAPCILFFDEIDAMVPRRGGDDSDGGREIDATVNQLLTLLDGVEENSGVFVLGATNRPGALDPALLRPGRLGKIVLIPSPDLEARKEILRIHTRNIPIRGDKNKIISLLAEKTEDFSGADLANLCREAVLTSLREDFSNRVVTKEHFLQALTVISPSVSKELRDYYNKFSSEMFAKGYVQSLDKQNLTYH
ncbi:MAG: AAA family ATPase [Candidatus Hodarchaeales archaeon]